MILALMALAVQIGFAQQKTVSGTVTDENGLPLPGATVIRSGTSSGTTTDFDGKYQMRVNTGDVLEISYVGYATQSVTVGASNSYNVGLQADSNLEEVVVVAYGTQKKESITGSVSVINADQIENATFSNPVKSLEGLVSGLRIIQASGQPGSDPIIRIRGFGSINADSSPLIVLDGVPYSGSLSSINPQDIESTTVLKGASSTSLYGNKASNGVLLITTKKGKKNRKPQITYENWAEAETYADIAMQVGSISNDVRHGFDEISLSETLWGAEVTATTSEVYSSFFSHTSLINDGYSGWNHFKTINSNLYDMIPNSDKRKAWFADQQYGANVIIVPGTWPHYNITPKYTSLKFIAHPGPGQFIGDYIYLRNTEFYLTKAEALARQNKDAEAQQVLFDLNTVRDENYVKSTKTGQALIDEILLYRRIELWGEGVTSFDMARLGIGLNRQDGRENLVIPGGDIVVAPLDSKMIFEIPQREIDGNPNINN